MQGKKALKSSSQSASSVDVSDMFSTYVYTGNGATQNIVNGIDLATDGGMVWVKSRSGTNYHNIFDTERFGISKYKFLSTNTTNAESENTNGISSFNTDGFTVGNLPVDNGGKAVSWSFKKQPRFFDQALVSHTTGTPTTVDLSSLSTVGMVEVKSTIGTSNWFVWHRSLTAGNLLYLNLTNVQTADTTINVSGTTLTISASAPTDDYIVYAHAHDPLGPSGDGSDGMIACGSYVGNGNSIKYVDLPFEPQYLLVKNASLNGTNWQILDVTRGLTIDSGVNCLYPNISDAEALVAANRVKFTQNGLELGGGWSEWNASTYTYIYMAIRRPMKEPKSSSEVFYTDTQTSTSFTSNTGFPSDMVLFANRGTGVGTIAYSRLTGKSKYLLTSNTGAEVDGGTDGVLFDENITTSVTYVQSPTVNYFFKRAKGFFDVVTYIGDGVAGRTVNHNLGVVPEMMWVKKRIGTINENWAVYPNLATDYLVLNSSQPQYSGSNFWNNTSPTDTIFTLGSEGSVNTSGDDYIAYLFSSLAGISKVGSYTGNGTNQTIDCGFTTGAKFIIIKRTDAVGGWYTWDSIRGIIAGNDPHLSLNTTAAEITTDDSVDPDVSGFIVNQNATTDINASGGSYIFYAIANPI